MFRGPVACGVSEDEWAGQVAVFARQGCDDTFLTRLSNELHSSCVLPVWGERSGGLIILSPILWMGSRGAAK